MLPVVSNLFGSIDFGNASRNSPLGLWEEIVAKNTLGQVEGPDIRDLNQQLIALGLGWHGPQYYVPS